MASLQSSASLRRRWEDESGITRDGHDVEDDTSQLDSDLLVQTQQVKKARTRAPIGRGQVKDVIIHLNKSNAVMALNIFRALIAQAPFHIVGEDERPNYVNNYYREIFEDTFFKHAEKYLESLDKSHFGKQTPLKNLCFLYKARTYGRLHNFFTKEDSIREARLVGSLTGGSGVKSSEHARYLRSELSSTKPFTMEPSGTAGVRRTIEPEHYKWRLFFMECDFNYTFNQLFISLSVTNDIVRPWDFFSIMADILPPKAQIQDEQSRRGWGKGEKKNELTDEQKERVKASVLQMTSGVYDANNDHHEGPDSPNTHLFIRTMMQRE